VPGDAVLPEPASPRHGAKYRAASDDCAVNPRLLRLHRPQMHSMRDSELLPGALLLGLAPAQQAHVDEQDAVAGPARVCV